MHSRQACPSSCCVCIQAQSLAPMIDAGIQALSSMQSPSDVVSNYWAHIAAASSAATLLNTSLGNGTSTHITAPTMAAPRTGPMAPPHPFNQARAAMASSHTRTPSPDVPLPIPKVFPAPATAARAHHPPPSDPLPVPSSHKKRVHAEITTEVPDRDSILQRAVQEPCPLPPPSDLLTPVLAAFDMCLPHSRVPSPVIDPSGYVKDSTCLDLLPADPTRGHVVCAFCASPVTAGDWIGPLAEDLSGNAPPRGKLGLWMHHACCLWSPEVHFPEVKHGAKVWNVRSSVYGTLALVGLKGALSRRRATTCTQCRKRGGTIAALTCGERK